ncbi:hypothetical protein LBMAG56_47880 [Verrucomicrobiota bacterium]|nr:hypothetical protein LBMAG56_47880 [Verrucomicrobiota bacterium]
MFTLILLAAAGSAYAAEPAPRFVGAPGCASAMCHGGAGDLRHQTTIWQKQDIHSRTYNTLVNARSAQIVAALKTPDATTSARCTSCHAPFHEVPPGLVLNPIDFKTGVSCESCHGPAERWLRPHTRTDFSHADRVTAGLRDLRNLYVRANTCVACHQTVDNDIVAAGHPELLFELDGQAVAQPRHWREKGDWHGPRAWFVGQAVALREMSWQLAREKNPDEKLHARWAALLWLLQTAEAAGVSPKALAGLPTEAAPANFTRTQESADKLARDLADAEWTADTTAKLLRQFAKTAADFNDPKLKPAAHARRAERLVLALDRLLTGSDPVALLKAEPHLTRLFQLAQSLPDFEPGAFGKTLELLAGAVP